MERLIAGPPAWYEWDDTRWYRNRRGYYQDRTGTLLHVAIWERANGQSLPDGHVIHHADHDKNNNEVDNLQCITSAEHSRHHLEERPDGHPWRLAQASESTRASALALWDKREPRDVVCDECGVVYQSTGMRARFCTQACAARHRRRARREKSISG
jgi:hypothetical protein